METSQTTINPHRIKTHLLAALALLAYLKTPDAAAAQGPTAAQEPQPASGIKWHPGHYIAVPGSGFKPKTEATVAFMLQALEQDASINGMQITLRWGDLEGDKAGDYANGFALIDGLLAKLAKLPTPKRLMISVTDRSFGNASGKSEDLVPQYIQDLPNGISIAPRGVKWSGMLSAIARLDNPAVMDRLIALAQAYGQRYNSNPLVEMYAPMGESAVSGNAGVDSAQYASQVQRLYTATSQAWPNTLIRWQLNYAPGDSNDRVMLGWLAFAKTLPNSAIGGPDPEVPLPLPASYPSGARSIQANQVFRGIPSSSASQSKYTDMRGSLPWVGEYQGAPMLGAGHVLPADFGNYEIDVMHASYIIYMYNTWAPAGTAGNDPHKWVAQQAFIDSTNGQTSRSKIKAK